MNNLKDSKGKNPLYSGRFVEVTTDQLATDGFNPGESFFLRIRSAGDIDVLGDRMDIGQNVLLPFFEGDNPLLLKRIIGNGSNTATGVYALFLDQ